MSNVLVREYVAFSAKVLPVAFVQYGEVYRQAKDTITREGGEFTDIAFWNSEYHRDTKGRDTLDSVVRRACVSSFQGFNPKSGREVWKSDTLAAKAWNSAIAPVVRGGIHSEAELIAAMSVFGFNPEAYDETEQGRAEYEAAYIAALEAVIRDCIVLGRIASIGRRIAKAYGLKAKAAIKVAFAAYDHSELGELHAKVAVAKLAVDTVEVSTFYGFTQTTLKAQEAAMKLQAKVAALRAA